MLTILHYIPSIDTSSGGVGAYMQLLAKDLGKLCELHVVTHHTSDELAIENATVHYISSSFMPWSSTRNEFTTLLDKIHPDVFHSNCCWLPLSALCAIWAKAKGYKVVYSPHGMLEPWIMNRHYWTKKLPAILLFQKRGIKIADVIHSTAESEKENLMKLGWNKNIEVIGNCVDVDTIKMKESWKRTGKILFLSRIHVKKGINFLIEAFKSVLDQEGQDIYLDQEGQENWELSGRNQEGEERLEGKDNCMECGILEEKKGMKKYELIIAGPGEEAYVKELKDLAEKLGISNRVHFVGTVLGDKKFDFYRDADIFVLPTHSENFGIVVAEALACGTPVITTKGTPWNELETEHCGWWIEIGTEATTEALRDFLQKGEDELEQMGKNGRRLIEEKYGSKIITKEFINLYNNC